MGGLAMAFYLHARCLEAWEGSTEWSLIAKVVNAVDHLAESLATGDDEEHRSIGLILGHVRSIKYAMQVEVGLNCSCPVALQDRANAVVRAAEATLAALSQPLASPTTDNANAFIRTVAATDRVYFSMVRETGAAVEAAIRGQPAAKERLLSAIRAIGVAERSEELRADVYRSELRSHRLTLEELLRVLDAPQLRVEAGTVFYTYPFSVLGLDSHPATKTISSRLEGHRSDILQWALHGLSPIDIRPLDINQGLTDLWRSADPRRQYRGLRIFLPPILIRTNDGLLLKGDVEARLSDLGNHFLRVRVPIVEGHPHFVYQALRRGSEEMGEEEVLSDKAAKPWGQIYEYAHDMISAISDRLRRLPTRGQRNSESAPTGELLYGPHHAVLSVKDLAVVENGKTRMALGTDLLNPDLFGARLFWHPVPGPAACLEEWLRYPESDRQNLVRESGFRGDLVLQTSNTTVIAMPQKPSFLITAFEEGAEFTASLRALLANWQRLVTESTFQAKEQIVAARESSENIERSRARLEHEQYELQDIKLHVQSQLALLKSPALCKTARNREYLDRLWIAAGLDKEEADLQSGIEEAQALYERYVAVVGTLAARRDEQMRGMINGLLSVIGITGLADFFGLLNDGWGFGPVPTTLELVFIVALLLVPTSLYFRHRKSRKAS
jgi:hypothetical protein